MAKIFFLFVVLLCNKPGKVFMNVNATVIRSNEKCVIENQAEGTFPCRIENGQVSSESCNAGTTIELPTWLQNNTYGPNFWDGNTVPHLKRISVFKNGSDTMLEISWALDNRSELLEYANVTRAFLVYIKQSAQDRECVLFNFQSAFFGSILPTFKYNQIVQEKEIYSLNLTSLPSMQFLMYNITVPQIPLEMKYDSLETWKTILAVSANQYSSKFEVVFEPAPLYLNASYYNISHNEADGNSVFQQIPIKRTLAHLIFPIKIPASAFDNRYFVIELTVFGADACVNGCKAAESLLVQMPPKPTKPPETPEPTTSRSTSPDKGSFNATTPAQEDGKVNLWVIIGVLLAALALIAILIIVYCVYKRKHKNKDSSYAMERLDNEFDTDSKTPSVLILYSYDCPSHEQVVIEFANFLKFEWHLDVHLDLWEQKDIHERGDMQWLNEKLISSHYVIVISSTGARYKCARNRQFRMKYDRPVPDMFTYAVDLALERYRTSKLEISQSGTCSQPPLECLVVCFNYSCANDIPPKLDTLPRFIMVKQLYELYCHLCHVKPAEKVPSGFPAGSPTKYKSTKSGKQLSMVLAKANDFFDNNPDWIAELLEPVSPPADPQKQKQKADQQPDESQPDPNVHSSDIKGDVIESVEKPSSTGHSHSNNHPGSQTHSRMSSNLSATEEDALLEERKKKRLKEEEEKMEKVASSSKLKDMVDNGNGPSSNVSMHPLGKGDNNETVVTTNGWDNSYNLSVPSNSDKVSLRSHSRNNSDYSSLNRSGNSTGTGGLVNNNPNGTANSTGQNDRFDDDIDAEELKRDIDFIHNNYYDPTKHDWDHPSNPDDILINMDFTGYTPPENVPLSLTYTKFEEYNNNSGLKSMNNNNLKLNGGPNLDFTNPVYFKMNGDAGDHFSKSDGKAFKSDTNDNFIIDFEIPQEKLKQISSRNRNPHISESSDIGTHL